MLTGNGRGFDYRRGDFFCSASRAASRSSSCLFCAFADSSCCARSCRKLSPSSAWARHFSRLTSKSRTLPRNACNSTFATQLFAFHLSRLASKEFTSTRGRVSNSRYTLSPNPVSISNLPVRSCAINHSPKSNLHMSQIKRSTPTFLLPRFTLCGPPRI